jgi:hypothetical protein
MRKTPVVLGVLSMVLGGVTAFTSLFGLMTQPLTKGWMGMFGDLMSKAPRRAGAPDPGEMMRRGAEAMEAVRPYQMVLSGTLLVLSLVVVVIGYGLYHRRAWSRAAAIGWAIAALCFVPVMAWIQGGVIQPRTQAAMYDAMPHQGSQQMQFMRTFGRMQAVAAAFGAVFMYTPFPVVLLALMGRKSAKNDLQP